MVLFPHAKINLGLQVVSKRHDGFHDIISCLYPINWCEVLEILEAPKLKFTVSGLKIPGDQTDNLCLQAYKLIRENFDIPPVHIHLHKAIPIGAGLGGGSADAVFTLKGLRDIFQLDMSDEMLRQMAAKLGSDCSFFIDSKPVIATGRGDQLTPISLSMGICHLLVVVPPIHVNTGTAYGMLTPKIPKNELKEALLKDIGEWQKLVTNDFEGLVFKEFPEIAGIKQLLLAHHAVFASLSGSGAAVFGVFREKPDAEAWFPGEYAIWQGELNASGKVHQ